MCVLSGLSHHNSFFLHTTYPSIWMNNLRYGNRKIQKHPQKMKVVDCAFRWNKGPTTILWTLQMCCLVPMSNQWETLWDKTLAINLLQMGFSSSFFWRCAKCVWFFFLPKNYRHLISSAEKKPCCPAQTFLLGACNSHNKNEHGFLKITLNNLKGNTSTCNLYVSPFTRPTHYCSVNFT